jgi:hypothetical protein
LRWNFEKAFFLDGFFAPHRKPAWDGYHAALRKSSNYFREDALNLKTAIPVAERGTRFDIAGFGLKAFFQIATSERKNGSGFRPQDWTSQLAFQDLRSLAGEVFPRM